MSELTKTSSDSDIEVVKTTLFRVTLPAALVLAIVSVGRAQVSVEQVLQYKPSQPGVEIDTPSKDEIAKCQLKVEKEGKGSGWVVLNSQGIIIRRFEDSDGNTTVDRFRYYQHGLEVFRDIDSNENRKVDESRWLNTGGSRWGVDRDEDGRIDQWKQISAEEATMVAIEAMAAGDAAGLAALLITPADVRQLGINAELAEQIAEAVKDPADKLQKIRRGSKVLTPNSKWVRFDTSMLMPGIIPAESGKAKQDLTVYENVMALVETDGQTGFVLVGELVQVGKVWKLTQIPMPLEGDEGTTLSAGGTLMQPALPGMDSMPGGGNLTPEVRKLLEELSELDQNAPGPKSSAKEVGAYNSGRARILGELAQVDDTPEKREQWLKQQIDGIGAGTSAGVYPNGLKQLQAIEAAMARAKNDNILPYVTFRRLQAEYNSRLQSAKGKERNEVQDWWHEQLEAFVKAYSRSEDAPDAAYYLAMGLELEGKMKEARDWYGAIVKNFGTAPAAKKARGAVRRMSLVGQPLNFKGKSLDGREIDLSRYKGKALLVIFWTTWCGPCTDDLPQIQALYKQYQRKGLEIVGVNLDVAGAPIQQYIDQRKIVWPHIHEEGGLESRPATDFGIISLPTMILVDKAGKVASVSTSVDDLKKQIPEILSGK